MFSMATQGCGWHCRERTGTCRGLAGARTSATLIANAPPPWACITQRWTVRHVSRIKKTCGHYCRFGQFCLTGLAYSIEYARCSDGFNWRWRSQRMQIFKSTDEYSLFQQFVPYIFPSENGGKADCEVCCTLKYCAASGTVMPYG